MSELERFRQQVRADFELTWGMVGDGNRRLDLRIDELNETVAGMKSTVEEVQSTVTRLQVAVTDLNGRTDRLSGATRNLGAEIQEGNRQLMGRMRLQEERFCAFMDAMARSEHESLGRIEQDIADLKSRVEALESRPPAA